MKIKSILNDSLERKIKKQCSRVGTVTEININHNILTEFKTTFISTKTRIENYADVHSEYTINKNWASMHISFMQMSLNLLFLVYVNIYQD